VTTIVPSFQKDLKVDCEKVTHHAGIERLSSALIQSCFLSELRGFSLRTSRFKASVCQTRTPPTSSSLHLEAVMLFRPYEW